MIDRDQLIKELFWDIRRLGFDPEDEYVCKLVEVVYEKGYEEGDTDVPDNY